MSKTTGTTDITEQGVQFSETINIRAKALYPVPSYQPQRPKPTSTLSSCNKAVAGISLTLGLLTLTPSLLTAGMWINTLFFSGSTPSFLSPLFHLDSSILTGSLIAGVVIGIALVALGSAIIDCHKKKAKRNRRVESTWRNPFATGVDQKTGKRKKAKAQTTGQFLEL